MIKVLLHLEIIWIIESIKYKEQIGGNSSEVHQKAIPVSRKYWRYLCPVISKENIFLQAEFFNMILLHQMRKLPQARALKLIWKPLPLPPHFPIESKATQENDFHKQQYDKNKNYWT